MRFAEEEENSLHGAAGDVNALFYDRGCRLIYRERLSAPGEPGEPGGTSTPGHGEQIPVRTTTMNRPETPSWFPQIPDDSATTTFTAESYFDKEFPDADKTKLKYKMDKNGRLQVGLIQPGKRYYFITTKIPGREEYQINKSLTKEVLKALGPNRRVTYENKIKAVSEGIYDDKKTADDPNENREERNKARERAKNK